MILKRWSTDRLCHCCEVASALISSIAWFCKSSGFDRLRDLLETLIVTHCSQNLIVVNYTFYYTYRGGQGADITIMGTYPHFILPSAGALLAASFAPCFLL